MAPIEQEPGYDEATDEVARARDALFGAQWRGYVARALSESGAAGGFRVEPERLVDAIAKLDAVLLGLADIRYDAIRASFDPPGYDDVSLNLAQNGAVMAARAGAYVAAWAGQLKATRDALQQELDSYLATDRSNAARRA